jgi:hypothetical protein
LDHTDLLLKHKRIAQAIIYFEPVWTELFPQRPGVGFLLKRNWQDNIHFKSLTQDQAIDAIEKTTSVQQLTSLMRNDDEDDPYYWEHWDESEWQDLSVRPEKHWIQFSIPPVASTVTVAIEWINVTVNFLQSALRCESSQELRQKFPQSKDGLVEFAF